MEDSPFAPPPTDARDPSEGQPNNAPGNLPEYSVSEISQALKRTVESTFDRVRVRGEISRPTRAASGHVYLTLKDDKSVLDGICWRGQAQRLSIQPEEGMEVICVGKLTTYPGRSKYQIVIESMELAGEGALLKLLEERKRRLAAEGLFDDARKRPLPYLPKVIGVVTSPTGAVIRDILHRLVDRYPVHVLVWPVLVQGEAAKDQVSAAIRGFNALGNDGPVPRPDLLIVARGGGSLEDLWTFNEEEVARAAAESEIPLISAVGHETDTTLIDFVSDRRAPTPTAAAEIAVPVRADLIARVMENETRLFHAVTRRLGEAGTHLTGLARGLGDPRQLIESRAQAVDYAWSAIGGAIDRRVERLGLHLTGMAGRLVSPAQQIERFGDRVKSATERLGIAGQTRLRRAEEHLAHLGTRLSPLRIDRAITDGAREADRLGHALDASATRRIDDLTARLSALDRVLESNSFERTLERGFVLVRDADGTPITQAANAVAGQTVGLRFQDGERAAVIDGEGSGGKPKAKPKPKEKPKAKPATGQESLF
ncbi:MAG: exodeoxyribonuclease VII large subunit [Rhodospirillaceae bacterium]|nr:exodeoxyribonuclease VII large subunit [Rhodospirillaceae bacterium]